MSVSARAGSLASFMAAMAMLQIAAWTMYRQVPVTMRFPLAASSIFAAVMLLAIRKLPTYHPFDRFGPANQVTTVRAALTAFVAGLAGEPSVPAVAAAAAIAASIATIIDGMDGWLARRSGLSSDFGARFDLEIDALLILALSMLAWRHDKAGAWIVLSGLLRYLFIAAGSIWSWFKRPLPPSRRRQAICVIQLGGLIAALLPSVRPPHSAAVAAVSLAALLYSFLVDILWLWRNRDETDA
jgi:phosphatidylglycerophosphate synthase